MPGDEKAEQPVKRALAVQLASALETAFQNGMPLTAPKQSDHSVIKDASKYNLDETLLSQHFENGLGIGSQIRIIEFDPVPPFDADGNLPPFHFVEGIQIDSPYRVNEQEFNALLSFNDCRRTMLKSFDRFLIHLRERGFIGVMWIGGSFVSMEPNPADIDITVFFSSPIGPVPMRSDKISHDPLEMKREHRIENFGCDCFFVDLRWNVERIVHAAGLWHGHFAGFTKGFSRGFLELKL